MDRKHFKVAGLGFNIEVENPWKFMEYTPAVLARIKALSEGGSAEITPIRAGDKIPPRTLVRCKSDIPEEMDRRTLDLSQYEPFAEEGSDGFTLRVCACEPDWLLRARGEAPETEPEREQAPRGEAPYKPGTARGMKLIMSVDDFSPEYYIYSRNRDTIFEFSIDGKVTSTLLFSSDHAKGELYLPEDTKAYGAVLEIGTALMMMYGFCGVFHGRVLFHSSVVETGGKAYMFLGKSGTGKSTHARAWLENFPDCELLNDDNPIVWAHRGKTLVYGSPWSGKTPCYRKTFAEAGGIVRLRQAGENKISRMEGLDSFAAIMGSTATFRWEKDFMDKLYLILEEIATRTPCWQLDCLPDKEAAELCREMITAPWKSQAGTSMDQKQ